MVDSKQLYMSQLLYSVKNTNNIELRICIWTYICEYLWSKWHKNAFFKLEKQNNKHSLVMSFLIFIQQTRQTLHSREPSPNIFCKNTQMTPFSCKSAGTQQGRSRAFFVISKSWWKWLLTAYQLTLITCIIIYHIGKSFSINKQNKNILLHIKIRKWKLLCCFTRVLKANEVLCKFTCES